MENGWIRRYRWTPSSLKTEHLRRSAVWKYHSPWKTLDALNSGFGQSPMSRRLLMHRFIDMFPIAQRSFLLDFPVLHYPTNGPIWECTLSSICLPLQLFNRSDATVQFSASQLFNLSGRGVQSCAMYSNGLDAELDEKLGYSRYDYKSKETDNSRKVTKSKSVFPTDDSLFKSSILPWWTLQKNGPADGRIGVWYIRSCRSTSPTGCPISKKWPGCQGLR